MKATYNHPHFPKGTKFEIPGVGEVENGAEVDFTPEMEAAFLATNGRELKDALAEDENWGGKRPEPPKEEVAAEAKTEVAKTDEAKGGDK